MIEKKFTKIENFEATLALTFDIPTNNSMTPEEKKKWKQQKKEQDRQAKAAKKAARAERIKTYEENIARKEKISKTTPSKS